MEDDRMKPWKFAAAICAIAALACAMLAGCQTQTYTPQPKEQIVSASALGQDGTLRVGVNANSAPLAGSPQGSTQIIGIDVDVAAYLADQLGLKLQVINVDNDPEAALAAGTVDIVLGVDASVADATYWRSEPYIGKGVALSVLSTNPLFPLRVIRARASPPRRALGARSA
jgi:polar amino acid transport system substrate-binding protein